MTSGPERNQLQDQHFSGEVSLTEYVPREVYPLDNPQTDIPRIAKDKKLIQLIEEAVQKVPTTHDLILGDARGMTRLESNSIHLVVTSPPYWTLKEYRDSDGQLGHIEDYDEFLAELDKVWSHCFRALVPGGRLICVVGDVCLSRRKNKGRHTVVPLHASIQEHCRKLGFDNLAPIIWHKIANAVYEVENGSSFLGKPSLRYFQVLGEIPRPWHRLQEVNQSRQQGQIVPRPRTGYWQQ
jgi:modification methylase